MGLAKSLKIESEERGWGAPDDKYACPDCLEDDYLKSIAFSNATCRLCSYCGRRSRTPIAAPLTTVLEPIATALFAHFEDPSVASVPRDTGEWVGGERITDTANALLSLPLVCHDDLFKDIEGAFHNTAWYPCANGHWLDEHLSVELGYRWNAFVDEVKHRSRFFFSDQSTGLQSLQELAKIVRSLGLITVLQAKTPVFRVRRAKPDVTYTSLAELGPPPEEEATAGRMNPAGVSYFYAAMDEAAALAELMDKPPLRMASATFLTKVDLSVLDLTHLPAIPSIFDAARDESRETLLFLYAFVDAISAPIARDGREHVEYVPSQVVSEFFARAFRGDDDGRLRAILFPSSVRPGGRNIVAFPPDAYDGGISTIIELVAIKHIDIDTWIDFTKQL